MTIHISARIAWHDSGWNGHICRDPKANTYCVGQFTYQGDLLAKRDVEWEQARSGRSCAALDSVPPCVHSVKRVRGRIDSGVWSAAGVVS